MARPTKYSEELVNKICEQIARGSTLLKICENEHMPGYSTVMTWKNERKKFQDKYARAREDRADFRFDEIDQILSEDMKDMVAVQRAKLKIDAKKWQMSKEAPKKYSDKVDLTSSDGTMSSDQSITVIFEDAKKNNSENS
ncbi:unnamed protein product [Commensalibacter communis]|uniref:terminase small subunit-like protein n=1 Tax=Commensalibacter communis TaxID=2972786 RepID=UPI0022FFA33D|nr:hypothetical protein [Commensalibacter communis]CAI3953976.1 unnamed protein product [Commensalibacter communis]CAI3958851.1 unnamed protein product [Commensalibacter communis]